MPLILFVQMQILARLFVMSDQLLKTGIVHLTRGHQHPHQGLFLYSVGPHAVLKRLHAQFIAESDEIVKTARAKAETRLTTVVETMWLAAG